MIAFFFLLKSAPILLHRNNLVCQHPAFLITEHRRVSTPNLEDITAVGKTVFLELVKPLNSFLAWQTQTKKERSHEKK